MKHKISAWFFFHDHHKDHVKSLDGLRGIAILLVLFSHAGAHQMFFLPRLNFDGIGKGGVYLFFVLSAFLLDQQITRALIHHKAGVSFWKRYFLRRFLRIYPLLFVALVLFLVLHAYGFPSPIVSGKDVLNHLILADGKNVFWSIPVEFKYYLLSPLLLLICHAVLKWKLIPIMLVFLFISLGCMVVDYFSPFSEIATLKHIIIFLTGTFVAIYSVVSNPTKIRPGHKFILGWMAMMALILCFYMSPSFVGDDLGSSAVNNGRKIKMVYALLCGVMLSAAYYGKGMYIRLLENKLLRVTGIISFSLYLLHMPVIYFMDRYGMHWPEYVRIYIFLAIVFLLSSISYLCIERPLMRLKLAK